MTPPGGRGGRGNPEAAAQAAAATAAFRAKYPPTTPMRKHILRTVAYAVPISLALILYATLGAQTPTALKYKFDPDWPKPLPNKWKMGGVTGLAVDSNDNVWVLNRPNDLTEIELHAELSPPTADCCVHPPSMIHIDKNGNVIGSFDAPQGHGMDVDSVNMIRRLAKLLERSLARPTGSRAAVEVPLLLQSASPAEAVPGQLRVS